MKKLPYPVPFKPVGFSALPVSECTDGAKVGLGSFFLDKKPILRPDSPLFNGPHSKL